jgi:hydrogenase nickel incorporation protein HypA/HybF
MHELSIALEIIDLTLAEADRRGGVAVHAVHLRLGQLGGVVKEALLAAFDLAREQSPLATCRLVIEEIPVAGYCETCQEERTAQAPQSMFCTVCGQPLQRIVRGRELEIAALEIES